MTPSFTELLGLYSGEKARLAKDLGVNQSLLNYWEANGHISERYALQVEEISDGQITARQVLEDARDARARVKEEV